MTRNCLRGSRIAPHRSGLFFRLGGMYFNNVKEVKAKDITLRVKVKDYRKAYIWEVRNKKLKGIRCLKSAL